MGSPVDILTMNRYEVIPEMDAILSIDTTKGNRIVNHKGIVISPTVKEGYILRISEDLLRIMEMTTGQLPVTFLITMQDITPYGNDLFHINSILQPAVATDAPVVGVAITAQTAVPGCGTGASHESDYCLGCKICGGSRQRVYERRHTLLRRSRVRAYSQPLRLDESPQTMGNASGEK